jgi:hypothetical protein
VNWMFRRAPRQKSMASRIEDFPLSPGPIKQLMPGEGSHINFLIPRKLSISTARILAM